MDTSCLEVGCPRCRRPGGGPSLVGLLLLLLGLLTRPSLRRPRTQEKNFELVKIEEEYVAYKSGLQKMVDRLKWELIELDNSMNLTKVGLRFWKFAN